MKDIRIEIKEKVTRKEDKIILFNILDKIEEANTNNIVVSTNVYNQYEIRIIKDYLNNSLKTIYITGGYDNTDRVILLICPEKMDNVEKYCKENISKYLSLLKIEYNNQYCSEITHRDVLGSILGLGISRRMIGNIYVNENNALVFVKEEISKYIIQNLVQIKNVNVHVYESKIDENNFETHDGEIYKIMTNSLRLDNILSNSLKLSRTKISEIINSGSVYINWKQELKNDKLLKISDVISIKGKGRIVINKTEGITKKGKIVLEIIKYM